MLALLEALPLVVRVLSVCIFNLNLNHLLYTVKNSSGFTKTNSFIIYTIHLLYNERLSPFSSPWGLGKRFAGLHGHSVTMEDMENLGENSPNFSFI